ncbi:MAG: hypothetical protein ABI091_23575 [Ferruginibacter sp.]
MKYKFISSFVLLIIVHSSFARNITTANHRPRYYASIQTMNGKIVKGLLLQMEDSSVALFPGKWKKIRKGVIHDSVVITYLQARQIKLKKKNSLLKGLLIGGGIGFAPAFFGEGGAYVALLTFPIGIITGAIVGITSGKKYFINGNYAAFNKMKKRYSSS